MFICIIWTPAQIWLDYLKLLTDALRAQANYLRPLARQYLRAGHATLEIHLGGAPTPRKLVPPGVSEQLHRARSAGALVAEEVSRNGREDLTNEYPPIGFTLKVQLKRVPDII